MAYGSQKAKENEDKGLDALKNPFKLGGRFVGGMFSSVDDMLRGLARAGGAVFSDIAEVVKEPLGIGPEGFWMQEDPVTGESTGRRASTYSDILHPVGKSFANTVDVIGDLTYLPNAIFKGKHEANAEFGERLQEYNDDPFNFVLEHVGNAAIVGAAVSKPLSLGVATSRGTVGAGQVARGLRPLAGRGIRSTARGATAEAAAEAAAQGRRFSLPQVTRFAEDVVGHPYRTAGRKISGSRPARLIRNPRAFDPKGSVDDLANVAEEAFSPGAEPTTRLYHGTRTSEAAEAIRREGFIPSEAGESGAGVYLSPDRVVAERPTIRWRDGRYVPEGEVLEVDARLNNVLDRTTSEGESIFRNAEREAYSRGDRQLVGEVLREQGYDAIRHQSGKTDEVVVLDPQALTPREPTVKLYRGMAEEFDPARVGEQGSRFTDDLDYALGNTNAERHPYLYEVEVPASRVDVGTSDFADILGENAGPRGALLSPEELGNVRRVDPETLEHIDPVPGPSGTTTRTRQDTVTTELENVVTNLGEGLGPVERAAQRIGLALEDIQQSQAYQATFAKPVRAGRTIRNQFREGAVTGTNELADEVRARRYDKDTPIGNVNVRRKWDPSRVERLLLRDLKNLSKRKNPARWLNLTERLNLDRVTPGSVPGRVGEVLIGKRPIGQTLDPQGLVDIINEVMEEVRRQSSGNKDAGIILKEMLPGVDPVGLHLLGLNALEKVHGLPENSLVSALSDYMEMDKFAEVNRRAQRAMRAAGEEVPSAEAQRFALPDEALDVDLDALGPEARRMFEGAAAEYRRYLAEQREPMLADEGIVPEGGSRIGLAPDEPTVFPTELDDLVLHPEWASKIDEARGSLDKQRKVVEDLEAEIQNLRESGRPLKVRDPEAKVTYRGQRTSTRLPTTLESIRKDPTFAIERWKAVREWIVNNPHHSALAVADDSMLMAARQTVINNIDELIDAIESGTVTARHVQKATTDFTYLERLPETRGTLKDYEAARRAVIEEHIRQNVNDPNRTISDEALRDEAIAKADKAYPQKTEIFEVKDPLSGESQGIFPESLQDVVMGKDVPNIPKPTRASLRRAYRDTQTGQAVKRRIERLAEEKVKLGQAITRLEDFEAQAIVDPRNAPVTARNLLTYAREVAPKQASLLRKMADVGEVGDPAVLRSIADELDAIPKTLDDLNSEQVYLSYLRDMKNRGEVSELGPGFSGGGRPGLFDTKKPKGARRRGQALDIDYTRDFRARAYWQDNEFQAWFLARQADEAVHQQGLVKSGKSALLEDGYTEAQIADMTPGQVQQKLEQMGLRVYQPDQLFGTARKPTAPGADPLTSEWLTPFVEESLSGAFRRPSAFERVVFEGMYDPTVRGWKVFALPLRFGWQVNNAVGNSLLSMLVGQVSPFDYPALLRASKKAVSQWNQGIPNEIRVPLTRKYRAELTAKLNTLDPGSSQYANIQDMLNNDAIIIPNEVLTDISSSGLTRGDFAWLNNSQFLRDIAARPSQNVFEQFGIDIPQVPGRFGEHARNIRQTGREVVDMAYHVNEAVDNMHRTMVYLDQLGKGFTHSEAMAQVIKTLGDYNKMSPFERRIVKRIYPFYPWMRHVTEVVSRSVHPSNINRTAIFAHLTSIMGEPNEWEALLPDWAAGHMYMGMDESGKPKFLSTRGLNPFLDVFDPLAQPNMRGVLRPTSPLIQFGFEQLSGVSTLTGKPFSSPTTPYGSNEMPRPPVTEYLARNIPQLGAARDVYRDLMGQPLTRYGTGEAAFFEGAEEGRSSLQDVQQLLGYNVKPLDVEGIREREIQEAFQKEEAQRKYEKQLEEQGGRQARDLLDALPGIG